MHERCSNISQKDECMKKIRELGSLPVDAFEKYQATNVKSVSAALSPSTTTIASKVAISTQTDDEIIFQRHPVITGAIVIKIEDMSITETAKS